MPPKAAANTAQRVIPADCVSVLLMALNNTTISKQQLDMMSALDGTRTASSFEHQFRSIVAKAKELKSRVDGGEVFQPVKPTKKRGGDTTPATPKKRKNVASDSGMDDTPSKKKTKTATPKSRVKKSETPLDDDAGEGFPQDAEDFIKREQQWEGEYV